MATGWVTLFFFLFLFGGAALSVPLLLIWTYHRRKMEELRLKRDGLNADARGDLSALRQEVKELRETATQYDLSFDTALQSMERRLARVEGHRPATPENAEALRASSRPY